MEMIKADLFKGQIQMAEILVKSGMLPKELNTSAKVFMIMQQGKELGLEPMQSINNIYIVNGRTGITSNLMVALIERSGGSINIKDWTKEKCVIEFMRDEKVLGVSEYTMDEAKEAGLLMTASGKIPTNWKKYPKEMLKARAVARGSRIYFASAIQGMYAVEELEAVNDTYNDVESSIQEVYESMSIRIESATTKSQLDKVASQIRKNRELKLLAESDIETLQELYSNKLSEFTNESDTEATGS